VVTVGGADRRVLACEVYAHKDAAETSTEPPAGSVLLADADLFVSQNGFFPKYYHPC